MDRWNVVLYQTSVGVSVEVHSRSNETIASHGIESEYRARVRRIEAPPVVLQ